MTTRNIVPQTAGEGGIGTEMKPWGKVFANNIFSPGLRERLFADATYYVRADGSDSNDGLATATAYGTIARALAQLKRIDAAGFAVTIDIGPGTWSGGVAINGAHMANASAILIYGAGDSTVI